MKLLEQPWWSEADQAELELLVREFVLVARVHAERCLRCGPTWCATLRKAFQAVMDWREIRILRSRAAFYRARQDVTDWEVG